MPLAINTDTHSNLFCRSAKNVEEGVASGVSDSVPKAAGEFAPRWFRPPLVFGARASRNCEPSRAADCNVDSASRELGE